jgi:DNA polymerase
MVDNLSEKTQNMQNIIAEITTCQKCTLAESRKKTVPGAGPIDAEIMLIGEGPGFHENEQGLPFVGQAGKFLDELLGTAGLARKDVFITNVVKCRPPGNRDPQPDELSACRQYLERQIAEIDPFVIVTLGRFSMADYFPNTRISQIHGKPAWREGRFIVPMYHPAAALHQPKLRPVVKQDFARLPEMVEKAKQRKDLTKLKDGGDSDLEATQLSLL